MPTCLDLEFECLTQQWNSSEQYEPRLQSIDEEINEHINYDFPLSTCSESIDSSTLASRQEKVIFAKLLRAQLEQQMNTYQKREHAGDISEKEHEMYSMAQRAVTESLAEDGMLPELSAPLSMEELLQLIEILQRFPAEQRSTYLSVCVQVALNSNYLHIIKPLMQAIKSTVVARSNGME